MLKIRAYCDADFEALLKLFYETVHTINAADYTLPQLDAWAPSLPDLKRWQEVFFKLKTIVADSAGVCCGFATLREDGLYDHLFVSKDYQRRGVASALTAEIERLAREQGNSLLKTEASITARPFFEKQGYRVVREQRKLLHGQVFINYVMEKKI